MIDLPPYYPDNLYYDETSEERWKRELLDLYYDLCYYHDDDPIMQFAQTDMKKRLNEFFIKHLQKSI